MNIESNGAHWIRAKDRTHALALLASLDGSPEEWPESDGTFVSGADWWAYLHGTARVPTGETETVDDNEVPVMAEKRGYYLILVTGDLLPPDGWEPWVYLWPDDQPWPVEIGGWREQMLACQEQAEDVDEQLAIPDTVPPRPTAEQREALADIRAQMKAAAQSVAEARIAAEKARKSVDLLNAEIDGLPERRQRANATILVLNTTIAEIRDEKDAKVAIAQDTGQDRETRQAARDYIERLNAELNAAIEERDRLVVWRDSVVEWLDSLRDEKGAAVTKRTVAIAALDSARADRDSTKAALLAARDTILGGV